MAYCWFIIFSLFFHWFSLLSRSSLFNFISCSCCSLAVLRYILLVRLLLLLLTCGMMALKIKSPKTNPSPLSSQPLIASCVLITLSLPRILPLFSSLYTHCSSQSSVVTTDSITCENGSFHAALVEALRPPPNPPPLVLFKN